MLLKQSLQRKRKEYKDVCMSDLNTPQLSIYYDVWNEMHMLYYSFLNPQCPDQSCKQDLLAYLEQIKLYSHQLKICSQVKAEIQNLGGELIMSAVSRKMAWITVNTN